MDFDLGGTVAMEVDVDEELILPPGRASHTDFVLWQSSQTSCPALESLIIEASAPVRRSPRKQKNPPPFLTSPATLSSSSSGSSLTRSESSRPASKSRSRFSGKQTEPMHRSLSSTNLFDKHDPKEFLNLIKDISEKVDVNVHGRATRGVHTNKVENVAPAKRKLRSSGVGPLGQPRYAKGKDKVTDAASILPQPEPITAHRSLPTFGPSSRAESSDGQQSSTSGGGVLERSNNRSPIIPHVPIVPSPVLENRSHMPPPPVPRSKLATRNTNTQHLSNPPTRENTPPINPPPKANAPLHLSLPPPKLHPLAQPPTKLSEKQAARPPQHSNSHVISGSTSATVPPPAPPRASQGPPPLGMRRAHTLPPTTTASTTIASRPKGFKPPLLPNSQPPADNRPQCDQKYASQQPHHQTKPPPQQPQPPFLYRSVSPAPSPSSPSPCDDRSGVSATSQDNSIESEDPPSPLLIPAADRSSSPDSSFGDMSFDMDALEETMRMYD